MRSPRRIAMLVLVFALLGAATTVAVAWGIAVRGVDPHGRRNKIDMTPIALADMNGSNVFICWPTISGPGWTWTATFLVPRNSISDDGKSVRPFGHTHGDHVGLVIERTGAFPRDRQLPFENNLYTEVRLGWPSVCMWAIERGNGRLDFMMSIEWSPVMYLRQDKIGQAKPFIRDEGSSRPPVDIAVPLGILSRGFAINTAFYAGAWWTLIFGLTRGRAWNRRRRGLCVKCTYDLRGLEAHTPCPECGRTRTRS
jgi:hypothetical protein